MIAAPLFSNYIKPSISDRPAQFLLRLRATDLLDHLGTTTHATTRPTTSLNFTVQ